MNSFSVENAVHFVEILSVFSFPVKCCQTQAASISRALEATAWPPMMEHIVWNNLELIKILQTLVIPAGSFLETDNFLILSDIFHIFSMFLVFWFSEFGIETCTVIFEKMLHCPMRRGAEPPRLPAVLSSQFLSPELCGLALFDSKQNSTQNSPLEVGAVTHHLSSSDEAHFMAQARMAWSIVYMCKRSSRFRERRSAVKVTESHV